MVSAQNRWDAHPITFTNPLKSFTVLAESDRGPLIIEFFGSIIGVMFNVSNKYKETIEIVKNFIDNKLPELKD